MPQFVLVHRPKPEAPTTPAGTPIRVGYPDTKGCQHCSDPKHGSTQCDRCTCIGEVRQD